MQFHEKFEALRNHQDFPYYDVFPVTKDPIPYGKRDHFTLTWQVAIVPALRVPNEYYFHPAGRKNEVIITSLGGDREELARFYHLASRNATPVTIPDHRERLELTIANMAIMANPALNPEEFDKVLYAAPERGHVLPKLYGP